MTRPTKAEARAIARGLTNAQREALLYGPNDTEWWGNENLGRFTRSLNAMERSGLGRPQLTEIRYSPDRLRLDVRLTPLGLAVRNHLRRTEKAR